MIEVPKIKAFQQAYVEDIVERIEDPPPPPLLPLTAEQTLQVHLATREVATKSRMNWNPEALRRLMNGKQEKNSSVQATEFESQER